jgi:hypothetical protein
MFDAAQNPPPLNKPHRADLIRKGRALRFAMVVILGWGVLRGAYLLTGIGAPDMTVSPLLPVPDAFRAKPESAPDISQLGAMPAPAAASGDMRAFVPLAFAPGYHPQRMVMVHAPQQDQASPFFAAALSQPDLLVRGGAGGWPSRSERAMAFAAYQDHMAALGKATQLARFTPAAGGMGLSKLLSIKPEADFIPAPRLQKRFTLDAWALLRFGVNDAASPSLAPTGQLGGSQGGMRLAYVLDDKGSLSAFARVSRPLRGPGGSEAAVGLSAKPFANVPLQVAVERRIALEAGGRDAMAAYVAGGTGPDVIGKGPAKGLEVETYGQAGIVGMKRRDGFVDAMVRLAQPVPLNETRKMTVGAAIWGGAQPGVSRIDIGPQIQLRGREKDLRYRLSVDWRERVAGDARPGSGVAITLVAGF